MTDSTNILVHGPLALDRGRWWLTVHGRDVRLTANQFRLMMQLMGRPGCFFSRDQLLDDLFGHEAIEKSPMCMDQLVHRTRRRLRPLAAHFIETRRDVGYRLRDGGDGDEDTTISGSRPSLSSGRQTTRGNPASRS